MSQRASNLRLAILLGVAAFSVWCGYVLLQILEAG